MCFKVSGDKSPQGFLLCPCRTRSSLPPGNITTNTWWSYRVRPLTCIYCTYILMINYCIYIHEYIYIYTTCMLYVHVYNIVMLSVVINIYIYMLQYFTQALTQVESWICHGTWFLKVRIFTFQLRHVQKYPLEFTSASLSQFSSWCTHQFRYGIVC